MAYKFTKLNIGNAIASVGGYLFKLLAAFPPAGLYDAEGNCIATWDELVNTYRMDCSKDYTSLSEVREYIYSPYYLFEKKTELSNGVKLVFGEVDQIGSYAFYGNGVLTEIVLSDSITSVGSRAFQYSSSLTKIVFGSGIKRLRIGAFSGCTGLQCYDFTACTSIPQLDNYSLDNFSGVLSVPDGCVIRVPSSLAAEWKSDWAAYAGRIVGV